MTSERTDRPPPDESILERNLERLLKRAYVQVAPDPAFRAALRARLLLKQKPAKSQPRSMLLVAAAVVLSGLAVLAGREFLFSSSKVEKGTRDLAAILDSGHVAMRTSPIGEFVEATSSRATLDSPFLEIATPPGKAFALDLAPNSPGRSIELSSATRVTATHDVADSRTTIGVVSGSVTANVAAPDPDLQLTSRHATVRALRGRITYEIRRFDSDPAGDPSAFVAAIGPIGSSGDAAQLLPTGESVPATGARYRDGKRVDGDSSAVSSPPTRTDTADTNPKSPTVARSRIVGRVLAGNAPVKEFRVTMVRYEQVAGRPSFSFRDEEIASDDGRYAIDLGGGGRVRVFVEADGFGVGVSDSTWIHPEDPPRTIDFALRVGATLRGRVLDAATGRPIEGALVFDENSTPRPAIPWDESMMLGFFQTGIPTRGVRTDSSGTFELTHVAASPHSTLLRVQSKGRSPRWLAVKGLYDGEERGDLEFRMTRGGRIHGVVTNDEGGPREKSVVIAFNQMLALDTFDQPIVVGITAADGSYAIEDLPPGMYSALDLGPDPAKDFSLYRMRLVTITGDEDLTVDFGPRAASADAVIRGRLVDAKGQGIPNAQLLFTKDPRADRAVTDWSPTSTDDSGAFAVRSLATGPYEVFRLTDNTELSQIARIEVTAATKELPPITLTRLRLECSIVDALSSAPVDDTYLILFREDANDGRFVFAGKGPAASGGKLEFTDLLPGRYRIGVSTTDAVHAVAMSDPIVVREGSGPVSAQIALSRAGRLVLELKGRGGAPVLHPRLEILNADATDFARVLDIRPANDGSIHIANVPAGSLKLRIFAEGFADHETQILVTENQETRAAIELIPRP